MTLHDLETPALLLDEEKMLCNIARMKNRLKHLDVAFRPHLKTCKSIDAGRCCMTTPEGPITVSTLAEAEYFAACGVRDILYAVCLAPNKVEHAARLRRQGLRLIVIVDSVEAARPLAEHARVHGGTFEVLIEIDCDGHRSGLSPEEPRLLEVAAALRADGISLSGVLTHAGNAYNCRSTAEIRALAARERDAVVRAARRLEEGGHPCPMVSVGSTPTALLAEDLTGVTEVRAGVFVFFDLVMAGLGVCTTDDIALSVLASVIGHQTSKGWIIVDAGWMALSRDRGTAGQGVDCGYGLVCDVAGRPWDGLYVVDVNQEHGIIARRDGGPLPKLPVGSLVRILPNHACATGAAFDRYHVLRSGRPSAVWKRCNGWEL